MILADEDFRLGGRLLAERYEVDGSRARVGGRTIEAELAALPEVRIMPPHHVFGVFDDGTYGALERVTDHLAVPPSTSRASALDDRGEARVLAAGRIERPIVFGDNDRPGVMLAGAVRAYLNRCRRRRGGGSRCSPTTTTAGARRPTCAPRASRSRR